MVLILLTHGPSSQGIVSQPWDLALTSHFHGSCMCLDVSRAVSLQAVEATRGDEDYDSAGIVHCKKGIVVVCVM